MKHTMVTFRLHTRGVLLLAIGAALLGALLFAAGYLTAAWKPVALPKPPALSAAALPLPNAPAATPPAPATATAPPPAPPAAAASAETFALRVGAFADEQEAKKSVQDFAARGFEARVVAVPTGGAAVLYTVRIGSYPTRAAAAAMADTLARDHGIDAAVIPSG